MSIGFSRFVDEAGFSGIAAPSALTPSSISFTGGLPDGWAISRSSNGWYINSSGVLTQAASNEERIQYDPETLEAAGIFVEPAATNIVPNPTGSGAGTPNTNPTGWSVSSTSNGLTKSIQEVGVVDGFNIVKIRWQGTTTQAGSAITYCNTSTAVNAANGEDIAGAWFVGIDSVIGSLANVSQNSLRIVERDSGGSFATGGSYGETIFVPTTAHIRTQRHHVRHKMVGSNTAKTQMGHRFDYASGKVIDVCFVYAIAQMERNVQRCSSPIPTNGTRAAETLTGTLDEKFNHIALVASDLNPQGTLYEASVVGGAFALPAIVEDSRDFLITRFTLSRRFSQKLQALVDFDLITSNWAGIDTTAAASAAPDMLMTIVDKELWPDRGKDVGDWGDAYMKHGPASIQAAQNVRDWLVSWATDNAMRLGPDADYPSGEEEKDFVSEREWTCVSVFPAYLKTKNSGVYSDADRALIEAWVAGIGSDIRTYYNWAEDDLPSKHNNHMQWGVQAAAWAAVINNDQDLLDYCVASIKHILDDSFEDVIQNDNVFRSIWNYLDFTGADQLESDRGNSAFFYNLYNACTMIMTMGICRRNGIDLFAYEGVNGKFEDFFTFLKTCYDDEGQAFFDLLDSIAASGGPDSVEALNVVSHATDTDKFPSFLIFSKLFPDHPSSAFIETHFAGGVNMQLGGDYGVLYDYLEGGS